MSKKLTVIAGGKGSGSGGGGGGKPPAKSGKGARKKRPHPFNELLWAATSRSYYPNRAESVEEIAKRMTKLSKRVMGTHYEIGYDAASHCIYDCRRRHRLYGWMLMHAQKGSGSFGGFIPVLADAKSYDVEVFMLYEEDLECVMAGLRSSVSTYGSMIQNDADSIPLLIGCLEAQEKWAEAAKWREYAAEMNAFRRRTDEMMKWTVELK